MKKKAALTLLRLYRKHPDVIPAGDWALRIVSIMDDQNLVRELTAQIKQGIELTLALPTCRESPWPCRAWS